MNIGVNVNLICRKKLFRIIWKYLNDCAKLFLVEFQNLSGNLFLWMFSIIREVDNFSLRQKKIHFALFPKTFKCYFNLLRATFQDTQVIQIFEVTNCFLFIFIFNDEFKFPKRSVFGWLDVYHTCLLFLFEGLSDLLGLVSGKVEFQSLYRYNVVSSCDRADN